ncbi:MAG: hypothetical protein M0D53_11885 [Flavobacterium sp. JAD_PAG50586_2]|nr:MAG: hypothetical protein M0D53_11885 [Flavobacterium sp. JAD_PAG50586_2]
MKNILSKIYIFLFTATGLLLSGCSELIDCVASARPDLHSKPLNTGTVGINYSDFVDADITNEPDDNAYDYFFQVDGNLPAGITYHEQGRKVFFTGVPTVAGTYTFDIRLTVDPPHYEDWGWNGGNRVCFGDDTITKEFTIVIQ